MLLWTAFILLAAWLIGMAGLYDVGDAAHALLLVGLMLLLIGVLRARDAAVGANAGGSGRHSGER
jgi:hypothetical protein